MTAKKSPYEVTLGYREKSIVLVDESRSLWAYLDEEGEPGKMYNTVSEVKSAIDRRLDTKKAKKFERVRVFVRSNPAVLYEVTSIKIASYGDDRLLATVVEAPAPKKGDWCLARVGDKKSLDSTGRHAEVYLLEGNEDFRLKLIEADKKIKAAEDERAAIKGGVLLDMDFFKARGDLD